MSHEIRTPLNAIIGYSELLEEEVAEMGDHHYEKDLKCIDNAAHHLLSLINDILDLSKIEAGKMELYSNEIDVADMAKTVCATIEPLAREKGNEVHCDILSDIQSIYADEMRLKQVLLNLLGNACKFTQNGHVSLIVRHEFKHGHMSCVFEVKDTGIGIAKEKQAMMFDAFVQADDSTTKEYGGTGLGLAISKRFCELMMGDIQVESDEGKGTRFIIRLPADGATVHQVAS
jgi:signal transduction histidine kinase